MVKAHESLVINATLTHTCRSLNLLSIFKKFVDPFSLYMYFIQGLVIDKTSDSWGEIQVTVSA